MKIRVTCRNCSKDLLVEQALRSGGRCPWCGESFQTDYAAVLSDAMSAAESAGNTLESALENMGELNPRFKIDEGSVLDGLRASLARMR